jgi:hypothetical protein
MANGDTQGQEANVPIPDDQAVKAQFRFDGAWLPDQDPSEIGPSNFRTMQNLRYDHGGKHPIGTLGYSKINTTALSSYPLIGNGIQIRPERGTTSSYNFVWTEDSGGTAKVYQNQTAIPNQGDFEATALHTDASGAMQGRFSEAPQGSVAYTNGVESYIWSGENMRVGGFVTMDDAAYTNPIDYTVEANNTLDTTGNTISIGTQKFWIVFTTRPVKGIAYEIKTANVSASTTTVKVWTGASFDAVTTLVDGTTSGGASLAQNGSFTFDTTVATAKPFHLEGLYLYAYLFEIDAGSAVLSHVNVNAPWQPVGDVWDGVYRQPIAYQVYTTKYSDYVLEVNTDSSTDYQLGAVLDALPTATGFIIVIFEERMAGIRNKMLAGLVNTAAAAATVSYWDGTAFTSVGASLRDETQDPAGDALGQTGLLSWSPPAFGSEHQKTQFGVTGYAYKIEYDANLSGAAGGDNDIVIDRVTGIPAQTPIQAYKFPSHFKNRLLLCGYEVGNEGNRVDFSQTNTTEVFNGEDSSANGIKSLYFGDVEPLTGGIQLYNRYGSNVFTTWVAFKKSSCYQLLGSYPGDESDSNSFRIKPISLRIGCPAPLTIAAVEGYPLSQDLTRNVVIWLSHTGPMVFDGGTLMEIPGVKKYFDPAETIGVNFAAIDKARGWYDATYQEYNLLIPSGASQTTNNVWLVYDLQKRKWFEKSTGVAQMPQSGWPVVDEDGNQYIYAGVDTGYVMRLEYGSSWDGTGITYNIVTGDFWPTNNIWDITMIRDIKIIAERIEEEHTLEIRYFKNTDEDEGLDTNWRDTTDVVWLDRTDVIWAAPTLLSTDLTFGTGLARLTRDTLSTSLTAWSHAFGFKVTTDDTERAFTPIGWGIRYYYIRVDE